MRQRLMCAAFALGCTSATAQAGNITEVVHVETPFDSDGDGLKDRIYTQITRAAGGTDLPTILSVTPYAFGGNDVPNNPVDVARLPQDEARPPHASPQTMKERFRAEDDGAMRLAALERGYASLIAHSIGTGYSTGCPTVGDETETLAAKAVIDWLNGRARAFGANDAQVTADWANGNVGMTGVSYNGTLPNMVATTGVEGLKAIIPVAAISNWYDYYRANGLVVSPGGYAGEDADVLGRFIVRPNTCADALERIAHTMGREHGDFTPFWQERDYVAKADGVKAAVFIMHGQSDWNVRQRHAIRWWQALEGRVPLKMWLHKGGHSHPSRFDTNAKIWAWFDRYVKGVANGIEDEPAIEVESPAGTWTTQNAWPHEQTAITRYYLNANHGLSETAGDTRPAGFVDQGKTTRLDNMLSDPMRDHSARLAFVTPPLSAARLLSGTPEVALDLAVMNRLAANITVALVEYDRNGRGKIVTRGWADPQNHADQKRGAKLEVGQRYRVTFPLEPKQHTFASGNRIGLIVAATDHDHTFRPDNGTEVVVTLGEDSFVELALTNE